MLANGVNGGTVHCGSGAGSPFMQVIDQRGRVLIGPDGFPDLASKQNTVSCPFLLLPS